MAAKKRLGPLDFAFLAGESRESMMHVGGLMQFAAPKGAKPEALYELMEEVRHETRVYPPWNLKLKYPSVLTNPLQTWVEDEHFDVEYHVRRAALPTPGGERELGILVSRLHSQAIDFHRPPWEVTFIEGLPEGRFAIYFKVHHSLVDGYTGMRLLARGLSRDPDERTPIFYAREPVTKERTLAKVPPTLDAVLGRIKTELGATRAASKALATVFRKEALVAPLSAPRTPFNARVGRNRRLATQQLPLERMKRVARAYAGTMNDLVLALSASALRRLLQEQDALPKTALTAMLPVNIRAKDDPGGGNMVGAILASLATDVESPGERLRTIIASTKRAKEQLSGLSQSAILQYSSMILAPVLLSQPPGAAGRVKPAFNVVISNVPGPTDPLYFRGYKLDAYYPLSIPFHGYGLNITVVTYLDTVNFGFVGDRDTVPHLQRLAVYTRDALTELEAGIDTKQ